MEEALAARRVGREVRPEETEEIPQFKLRGGRQWPLDGEHGMDGCIRVEEYGCIILGEYGCIRVGE